MTARADAMLRAVGVLLMPLCLRATLPQSPHQVCHRCDDSLRNASAVGNFCTSSGGLVVGRCCLRHQQDRRRATIVGLDLSNCALTTVSDLHQASTAIIIDLSVNPILNMSDTVFQGFTQLRSLRLPLTQQCPGGNESWQTVQYIGSVCLCEGQKDACYRGGNMSWSCPENSLCAPYGPGFTQCCCSPEYHGYKCLRKGRFPMVEVLGILGASTVLVSGFLWVTQRRKVKAF